MPLLLHPRRWRPPAAPDRAREEHSATPLPELRLIPLPAPGPEDVVVDHRGRVLTGLSDGRVIAIDPVTGDWTELANTGGRPLGLEACPDGSVLCCDSRRGLLRIDPEGEVEVLVGAVGGVPLNFASNVVRAEDGTIYFSASCRRHDLEHYMGDLLEHSGTGRLFRLAPGAGEDEVETLLDGLDFANGVVLAPDGQSVVVAQTAGYCVTRYWLTGPAAGTSEPLLDNLPGFPDNMALGSDGLLWISLPTARNPILDRLLPLPGVLRQLSWVLPARLRPVPASTVWAIAVSWDGEIVHDRQGPHPEFSMVTAAVEHDGTVYLGSLHAGAVAAFDL